MDPGEVPHAHGAVAGAADEELAVRARGQGGDGAVVALPPGERLAGGEVEQVYGAVRVATGDGVAVEGEADGGGLRLGNRKGADKLAGGDVIGAEASFPLAFSLRGLFLAHEDALAIFAPRCNAPLVSTQCAGPIPGDAVMNRTSATSTVS